MRRSLDAGFTLIELLIVVAVVGIIAGIAIPGLLRARMAANEASAIGSMRAVSSSQHVYMSSCGHGFYAAKLTILADPVPTGAPFISPELGVADTIVKSGYQLDMAEGSEAMQAAVDGCNPLGVASDLYNSYWVSNQPLTGQVTGSRWFWANSQGTIFADTSDVFDTETNGTARPAAGVAIQ